MKNYPLEMTRNLIKAVDLLDKLFQQAFVIASEVKLMRQLLLDQQPVTPKDPLLSANELATKLQVSRRTIDHWTFMGKLIPYRIGNRPYFKFGELPTI